LDPLATVTLRLIAQARILEGRYDETVELAQELLLRAPNDLFAKTILLDVAHTLQGRADLALQDYRRLEPKYPQVKSYEAETLACAGRRQEALALIRPFEERHPHGEMPNLTFTGIYDWGSFAGVYACMGDEAQTVKWLQKAADNRDAVVLTLGVNPIFAKVRNAPGVQAVMKRVGLKH
jgi:tetratricopeptide (TPR) repeat protein